MAEKQNKFEGWLAGGGIFAGALSFIGASCCVLPFILVNLGVSSALLGNLAFFARYQAWFQWASLALIVGAVFFAFRHRRANRRLIIFLAVGTILVILAFVLPYHEGELLRWLTK
ncbi:MAG: hypothetical protein KDD85_03035 [Parvularculaceae bacterium]|nr:hypothetical protein [Parvularculaceae bacterium]